MAESCPGTTKSSLEGIQAVHQDETYSAALAELVNAQKKPSGGILGRWNNVIV
ncbi:Putative transposase (identified by ISEscan HMM) [Klebsiella pneumoniae]|nr:Putative transposase (identified by ISEscan HMM) [Klebsiella pneumoniae]